MTQQFCTQQTFALAEVDKVQSPFPHIVVGRLFEETSCQELLNWLENGVPWIFHQSHFYQQLECNLKSASVPPSCQRLFSQEALAFLRSFMEEAFSVELSDQMTIIAHKLLPGYCIGIHNDAPDPGMEKYRLVVHLSRDHAEANGGHLVFYRGKEPDAVDRVFAPVFNTAVGFELSDSSYHSVKTVEKGVRYTVIYSFWMKQAAVAGEGRSLPNPPQLASRTDSPGLSSTVREVLVGLLRALGVDQSPGSEQLDHLMGTCRFLERWRCCQSLCIAGLFHSVYGTETFKAACLDLRARGTLQEIITEEAETLVYLYGVTSRRSLYEAAKRLGSPALQDFRTGESLPITRRQLSDLLTLDLANGLERSTRIAPPPELAKAEKARYRQCSHLLPEPARRALRKYAGK